MVELLRDSLQFSFPTVHEDACARISFIRTLRIPDDNREYFLPPGFSEFPLNLVDDYVQRVPEAWGRHGGVFLPMYQAEAMWLSFSGDYPMAIKIAAGKINAVTGESWQNTLSARSKQDYMVIPEQPWLDGFYAGKGLIRQFVAMQLGEGYTAEEQLTGQAVHGGLQCIVYPMKAERYEELRACEQTPLMAYSSNVCYSPPKKEMGLAPGGLMRQKIYEDDYGIDAWDQSQCTRCFVHILNSQQYVAVTGRRPPTKPPTAQEYTAAGLPWFDYYDQDLTALQQASTLMELDSVEAKRRKKGEPSIGGNDPVTPALVKTVHGGKTVVREWA